MENGTKSTKLIQNHHESSEWVDTMTDEEKKENQMTARLFID